METGFNFREIYIGTPDGEIEAKNDMFEKLFIDCNNKYSELTQSSTKFLVIGSKGSGKTYLANYICKNEEKNGYNKIISCTDFLVESLCELQKEDMDRGYMYAFCSWYIYKKIAQQVLDIYPIKSKYCFFSHQYKLRKFYEEYHNEKDIFKIERKRILESKGKSSAGNGNVKIGLGDKTTSIGMGGTISHSGQSRVDEECEMVRKEFFELLEKFSLLVLRAANPKNKICLIFDDLDELERKGENESENNITINLVKAARDINIKLNNNKRNVKVVLLVRSDILNKLQHHDMNLGKIKASCGIELYWLTNSQTSPECHPLMHMVLHKIKTSCSKLKVYSEKELYSMLFPEKIDGKSGLEFLLDHSLGRPRDIVLFLNHYIEQYPESSAFTALELKAIKKLYASDFYDELLNQIYYHKDPEYTRECMSLISGLGITSFSINQVKEHYENNLDAYPSIKNIDDALEFLYEMSVIGNSWDQGKKTSWAYRKDSLDQLDKTKRITIHYALRKKFAL